MSTAIAGRAELDHPEEVVWVFVSLHIAPTEVMSESAVGGRRVFAAVVREAGLKVFDLFVKLS